MKVERAIGLLPKHDALAPLRALVLASSTPGDEDRWGSGAPYLTVAKWRLSTDLLRTGIPGAIARVTGHLEKRYRSFVEAIECEERGDISGMVLGLLAVARLEASIGRYTLAHEWALLALREAEGLSTRKAEVQALVFLGAVGRRQGLRRDSARYFQRALGLAEAESDLPGTVEACEGLGWVALGVGQLPDAQAWLQRAEELAAGEEGAALRPRLRRGLAEVARRQGDPGLAIEHLLAAQQEFEALGAAVEVARTLDARGRIEHAEGRLTESLTTFREALAWHHRGGEDPWIECSVRLDLAALYLSLDRIPEAEREMRAAERLAITWDLGPSLMQVYVKLGALRARQQDETGFVFFEQAVALAPQVETSLGLEAEVFLEYGRFKATFGHVEEAREWLRRAHALLSRIGDGPGLAEVDAELDRLAP